MSDQDQKDLFDEAMTRLGRLTKVMWGLIVGAFLVGGWAAIQQSNIAGLYEKVSDISRDNSKIREEVVVLMRNVSEIKDRAYTFREAQAVTERLVILETKFAGITESFDDKLTRLESIILKQSSLGASDASRIVQTAPK
jgi:hypothetical protein